MHHQSFFTNSNIGIQNILDPTIVTIYLDDFKALGCPCCGSFCSDVFIKFENSGIYNCNKCENVFGVANIFSVLPFQSVSGELVFMTPAIHPLKNKQLH